MPQPNKIPLPFAASGDKNAIPESTETTGLASWREGFPAITSAPFSEGGIAPKRADFNGIFNALSQAVMWLQQGGVYAYDADTDYEAGNVVLDAGGLYVANAANGPSSVVVQPSSDTTGATWKLVRLGLATQSAAGYMSAADKKALDNTVNNGTFNKLFFAQTSGSYTAPYTGTYRITLKGGGGGGGNAQGASASSMSSGGGGEGGTITFYKQLTEGQSYSYIIGAGGAVTPISDYRAGTGGTSSFNGEFSITGGTGGENQGALLGGRGGYTATKPAGAEVITFPGQAGQSGVRFETSLNNNNGVGPALGGGGGVGQGGNGSGYFYGTWFAATAGSAGGIWIEYMG